MSTVIIYLSDDYPPQRDREFLRVADTLFGSMPDVRGCYPAHNGEHLLRIAGRVPDQSVSHLVLVCHGSPTGFLHPGRGRGVHCWKGRRPDLIGVYHFADAYAPLMASYLPGPDDDLEKGMLTGEYITTLISLCACLCSRSPHWYLSRLYGRYVSPWGPDSYRDGGEHSIAAALRDAMLRRGVPVRVRGHTAAGHVTDLPLLREHGSIVGDAGRSLFRLALPDTDSTWSVRRRWVRLVQGELARRWLLGDDTVVDEIRALWGR